MLNIKYKIKGVKTEYEIGREFIMSDFPGNSYKIINMKKINNSLLIFYVSRDTGKIYKDYGFIMDNSFKSGNLKWIEHV